MRTALKNKQKLKYALYHERQAAYETDDNGDIIYTEVDGERIPVESGYAEHFYDEPVDFIANIMPVGSESYARANVAKYVPYGINISDYNSLILVNRGEFPITESSLIWFDHTPTTRTARDYFVTDDETGEVISDSVPDGIEPSSEDLTVWDETTADFIVKRVASSQNITLYLLQGMNHGES